MRRIQPTPTSFDPPPRAATRADLVRFLPDDAILDPAAAVRP